MPALFWSNTAGEVRMDNDRISNRIRRLRFDHGEMTQQQLADKVGVTRQTILAIEAGKYSPSLPLAFRIARAFNASVEDVFQYADGETPSGTPKAIP
jgi:putative transcriptional regulator